MIQKEVAVKFAQEQSGLGIIAHSVGNSRILFDVDGKSFSPPPKVTSSVLQIIKIESSYDDGFSEFLKFAFVQPRKKLITNLSSGYDKVMLEKIFLTLDMSLNLRPHQLSTSNYHLLYKKLSRGGI
jgi:16S rRNA (adenine1518-N6/adenine1519-N6)-dimethyltransferase